MTNSQLEIIEKTLSFTANKGWAELGSTFLDSLTKFLGELFNVDYVLIDKYSKDNPNVAETISVYSRGSFLPNMTYELNYTPCENVIGCELCSYEQNIQKIFPKDELLKQMNVDSYVGIPLWSSLGDPIGLIAVMDSKPVADIKTVEIILQIVAIKAAHELERFLYESKIAISGKELVVAHEKVKENERRLNFVIQATNSGVWEWNIETNEEYFSPRWCEIIGYDFNDKDLPHSFDSWAKRIHPDDNSYVMKSLDLHLSTGSPYDVEYRHLHKSGEYRWQNSVGQAIRNQNGKPIKMVGCIIDITERKKKELELKIAKEKAEESENQLKKAQKTSKVGNWIWYIQENKLWWSDEMYNIFEIDQQSFNGELSKVIEETIYPEDRDIVEYSNNSVLMHNKPIPVEYRIKAKNGSVKYVLGLADDLVLDENGQSKILSGIVKDITDYKIVQNELLVAKERAEESDRLKTAFLQNISHEIRTPMNAIIGFTDMLKKKTLTEEKRSKYLDIINSSGNQLLTVVNDILTVSMIETNQERIILSNAEVNPALEELKAIFEIKAAKKGIRFDLHKSLRNEESAILVDVTKLKQILTNLLTNSFKFTTSGFVEFGYILNNDMLEFYVKDSGIGIDKLSHDLIFERFHQMSTSISRNYDGMGLGLSITKSFVELLGGKIWVESELGEGSIFKFTIPYKPVQIEKKSSISKPSIPKGKVILIAEDEMNNFLYMEELLNEIDARIIHAKNGKEAVEMFKDNSSISLVIMDIKMPIMNGYEATKLIREIDNNIPIIANTAFALPHDREKARDFGFNEYLSKPINQNKLFEVIEKYISLK